ncbi:MAG: DNA/RNA nuclease SfsA, partial [Oscillospiraceae bacterium]
GGFAPDWRILLKYSNIRRAVFLDRPNRFIANILLEGEVQICHVKNTGRCRELLLPGAEIYVQDCPKPERKTKFDLISVRKDGRLINIDSNAPNRIFSEWVISSGLFKDLRLLRRECTHGDSRFDFYLEADRQSIFVEVKGVTLEENGVVRFPDAPTERGVKHLRGLINCVNEGLSAYIVFIIQMQDVKYFEPNIATQPEFAEALRDAKAAGVHILALDCKVTESGIYARNQVEVRL